MSAASFLDAHEFPTDLGGGSSQGLPPAGDADGPADVASPPPSTTTGCACGHSRTAHDRYRHCCAEGCLCSHYTKRPPRRSQRPGV